jgi:hypothetical protein
LLEEIELFEQDVLALFISLIKLTLLVF